MDLRSDPYFFKQEEGSSFYSIGLYAINLIKPYGQRAAHFEKNAGWKKIMVDFKDKTQGGKNRMPCAAKLHKEIVV